MYEVNLTESYFPAQTDLPIREITIGDALREAAERFAARPALTEVLPDGAIGRRWTHAELLAEAERLALALASRFEKGERLVIWAPNVPEWSLVEFACALSGVVLVTANPAFQAHELRYVLEQSAASALFLVAEHRGNPMAEIAAKACDGLEGVREVVDLRDRDALFRMAGEAALPALTPDDRAMMQYTSGTTGFPKGAVLSHRGLINNALHFMDRIEAHEESRWSCHMPMFHTSGCGMAQLGAIQVGAELFMVSVFDPNLILDLIERERITAFTGVPTMMVAMLEAQKRNPRDLSSVEMACSGGSMVAPELVRAVQAAVGCRFETVYGQTETSPLITQHFGGDTVEDISQTAGQPVSRIEVAILDTGDGAILPLDTVGEICTRGYHTMIEYFRNPEATAKTVDENGWLHTGDLGRMDSRGYVALTGRVKEMIIRGGENFFPAEIENALLEHPSVSEVAVVGLPDETWGEIIACFAVPRPGETLNPGELKAHCRARLAPQKTPEVWVQVGSFPLTGSGKIQKFALRDAYLAGEHETLAS